MKRLKDPLTRRQADVLRAIREYQAEHGIAPTLDELGQGLGGVNKVTVLEHLRKIEAKGWIEKLPNRSRALIIHPEVESAAGRDETTLPIAGSVAAGRPLEAVASQDRFDLKDLVRPERGRFLLRVKGQSMIDDHIEDGDLVIVEPCPSPKAGATVVALLDGQEATLKRYYPEKKHIRLEPRNPGMPPIYADPESLTIQGVLVGVIRMT